MGTSAKVVEVIEPAMNMDGKDKNYAMKIINRNLVNKQSKSTEGVLAEFEILKKLYHPNII